METVNNTYIKLMGLFTKRKTLFLISSLAFDLVKKHDLKYINFQRNWQNYELIKIQIFFLAKENFKWNNFQYDFLLFSCRLEIFFQYLYVFGGFNNCFKTNNAVHATHQILYTHILTGAQLR